MDGRIVGGAGVVSVALSPKHHQSTHDLLAAPSLKEERQNIKRTPNMSLVKKTVFEERIIQLDEHE